MLAAAWNWGCWDRDIPLWPQAWTPPQLALMTLLGVVAVLTYLALDKGPRP